MPLSEDERRILDQIQERLDPKEIAADIAATVADREPDRVTIDIGPLDGLPPDTITTTGDRVTLHQFGIQVGTDTGSRIFPWWRVSEVSVASQEDEA